MRQMYHSNNSFVVNNFVMKCIGNIFYLLFSAVSDKKTCAFFRASVFLNLAMLALYIWFFTDCMWKWYALRVRNKMILFII